ncbi:MAG: pre-peptidase C-terminal domain-containing protein [Candidatus Hydrogenedentes bacterium]|nr:pre-peptidase C-terminal domain-containing protein [Candidatus Hydrogenedentota bacterium]
MIWVSFSRAARALLALAASAVLPCVPWAQEVDFDREVKLIFQKSCSGCHFPESGALKAKLDLSTAAAVLAGSANGAVIIPGKGGESPLIQMVEHKIEPHMPPEGKGAPLTPEAIDILKRWVDQGAKASPTNAPAPAPEPAPPSEPPAQAPSRPAPITALAYGPSSAQPLLAQGSLHRVDVLSVDASGVAMPKFTLGGHAEMVRALAFSPDGTLLAAAGGNPGRGGEVKLWNVAEHRPVATLQGHRDNILGAAFSPDGQRLATCSYDKTILVWDIASGTPVLTLANHVDAVYAVAYSPDGQWIASGAGDRTVKLWDAASGALAATISDSLDSVLALAFSPAGDQLAGAGADKMIRIWDMRAAEGPFQQSATTSGVLLRSTFAHDGAVLKLAYSPDGATLYSTSEDLRIKAWDTSTLQEKLTFEAQPDWVTAMAVSPDGAYLAAGRYDSSRAIYAAGTGQRIDGGAPAPAASVASAAEPEPAAKKKVSSLSVEAVIVEATVPPSVSSVAPVRWHRGTDVEVVVDGKNLDRAEPIITTDKIVATLLSSEALPLPELKLGEGPRGLDADILDNAQPFRLKLKLAIAQDAPVGRHEIMFRTPIGMSSAAAFDVLPAPDTPEAESNSAAGEAQPVQWPGVVIGRIDEPGDVDRYRLAVKAGQDVVFAITDSALNASLRVLDASGAALATNEGSTNRDSKVLGFRAPADGDVTIELADVDLRGDLGYRLHVGAFPLVTSVWPLGVQAGPPTKVQVKGFNLPGDTLEIDPPDQAPYGTAIPLPLPSVEGNPIAGVSLAVGAHPEALESEPNDSADAAQAVPFPATLNGRMDSRDAGQDEDLYRFSAAQGQTIVIEIEAARFGSPLDSRIEVLDASGNPLQRGVVRCLAETFLTLSPRDSRSGGLRLDSWRDLRVNDDVMIGGEIVRVFRLPDYADEDVSLRVFPNGQRMTYYGTTPEHHARAPRRILEVLQGGSASSGHGFRPEWHAHLSHLLAE